MVVVGMGGKPLEVDDLRAHGDLLAKEPDALHAVKKPPAERTDALVADEHHGAVVAPEIVLQMVADTPRVAHTGRGNDDLGCRVHIEQLRLLRRLDQVKVGEREHVRTVLDKLERLFIKIAVQIAAENGGRLLGKRRVDIDRKIGHGLDKPGVLDLADKVQKLLRAPDGERRNDDIAALGERLVNDLRQLIGIAPHLGMVAVAVGRFHDDIIRLFQVLRIADDGLIDIADVAGENDGPCQTVFAHLQRDGGRAEQVSRVGKGDAHTVTKRDRFAVLAGGDKPEHILRVFDRVDRLDRRFAGALALAVVVLGLAFLNVRAVQQHDLHQIRRQARGKDLAAKAVFDQQRDPPGMVDMRMRHQNIVDLIGRKRQRAVVDLVASLLQTAIDEDLLSAHLKAVA